MEINISSRDLRAFLAVANSLSFSQAAQQIQDGLLEVALKITVAAKSGEKTLFLVEVEQAAIFQIRNVPEAEMGPVLGLVCPNIVFPYVRETVSDLINRSGFPPVLLAPINFEALYQQQLAQQSGSQIQIAN